MKELSSPLRIAVYRSFSCVSEHPTPWPEPPISINHSAFLTLPHFLFPSSRTTTISAPMAPLLSQNYETISPVSELADIPSLLSLSDSNSVCHEDSAIDTSNDISGNSSHFCLPRHFPGCILGTLSYAIFEAISQNYLQDLSFFIVTGN